MSRGYRAVSTRDIADAVGLTQPALYHHFGGKEALYVAVLEDELATMRAELDASSAPSAPGAKRLSAVATVLASHGEHDLAQMFHDLRQEISETNRRRIGLAFRGAMLDPILSVVDALVDDASIDLEAAGLARGEVAMLLLSNVRMLVEATRGPAAGAARSPQEIGRVAARLLLRALAPPGVTPA